jgi:hypothetical protein
MPNDTTHPYSVPTHYQCTTQAEFQGGKAKVLELLHNKDLYLFLEKLGDDIIPIEFGRWFALDCAKFVLPVFEKKYPSDKRVRNCIEVNESFLKGDCTLDHLLNALSAAFDAASDAYRSDGEQSALASAAEAVVSAARCAAAFDALIWVYTAADEAADATSKDEMQGFVKNWIDNYFNI